MQGSLMTLPTGDVIGADMRADTVELQCHAEPSLSWIGSSAKVDDQFCCGDLTINKSGAGQTAAIRTT